MVTLDYSDDVHLVERLRDGDEQAFVGLVQKYHTSLIRMALVYVTDRAVAEEVVQDTWIGVLRSLKRFEGRSSLKTWLYSILANRARTRAQQERRASLVSLDSTDEGNEPSVDPERFFPGDHPSANHFREMVDNWEDIPEVRLLSDETQTLIRNTIELLPPNQREVITLRDIDGWSSEEVCAALEISEANQRVLLHRARSKVRQELENYLKE